MLISSNPNRYVWFSQESCSARESARLAEARLGEAEREAAEMQDFLAAETGALSDSLRDAETELARVNADLERRYVLLLIS